MNDGGKIDIAICVVTYNQEKYIAEAINSILDQKTTFTFKIYIGEDNSSDKTLEICKALRNNNPSKIILIENKINLGLVKNTINVLERIKNDGVKYVAMLDGDDYWIDDEKLQKQCSFLEENKDYGLVYSHSASLLNGKLCYKKNILLDGKIPVSQMKITPLPNNTVMFKTVLLDLISFREFIDRKFMSCDYAMYVYFSQFTKIKGMDFFSAVVRRGHNSVSHPSEMNKRIQYIENDIAQFKYLGDKFPAEIPFTEEDAKNHRDYMTFNIAVKYRNYELASSRLHDNPAIKKAEKAFLYRLKVFFSSNKLLFYLWCEISSLVKLIIR